MGTERTVGGPTTGPDITVESVTITVLRSDRGRRLRERLAGIQRLRTVRFAWTITAALVAIGAVTLGLLASGRTGRGGEARGEQVQRAERTEIAAAFGFPYPLRCLTIAISAREPDYARAEVDRANGCWRYRGYINASFHRVAGTWRLLLDEGQLFVPNGLLTRVGTAPRAPTSNAVFARGRRASA